MQHEAFDPYRKWLGIAPKDQPPNFYRLLGIDLFESDQDVIAHAADQRMTHVRTFQSGPNAAASQQILNEISAAKLCLLDTERRMAYDVQLRGEYEPAPVMPPAAAPARPLTVRKAASRWRDEPEDAEVVDGPAVGTASRIPKRPGADLTTNGDGRRTAARSAVAAQQAKSSPTGPILIAVGVGGVLLLGLAVLLLSSSRTDQPQLGNQPVNQPVTVLPVVSKPPPPVQPKPQPPRPAAAPRMAAVSERTITAGNVLELDVLPEAPLAPGQKLRYAVTAGPRGAKIDDNGRFSFQPPEDAQHQSHVAMVSVRLDGGASEPAYVPIRIHVQPQTRITPPRVDPIAPVATPAPVIPAAVVKAPVPPAADVAKQVALIQQEMAQEFADTSRQGKLTLASKLRSDAQRTPDLTRRYAMLAQARDLAASQSDVAAVWQAIDVMEMWFALDGIKERADALQKIVDPKSNPAAAGLAAMFYNGLLQRALWSGHFVAGEKLIEPAIAMAALAGNQQVRNSIITTGTRMRELAREEEAAERARTTLAADAANAEANFRWGRFLTLMRNDSTQGLPLLARGSDEAYKAAAEAELKQPTDPVSKKLVGDRWWTVQAAEPSAEVQRRAMQRVLRWYGQARAGLDQVAQAEVDVRIKDIQAALSAAARPVAEKPVPENPIAVSPMPEKPAPVKPAPPKPAPDKPVGVAEKSDKPKPTKPTGPEVKPLEGAALTKVLRTVLERGGRVQLAGGSDWIRKPDDLPAGDDLVVKRLAWEKNQADESTLRAIGRMLTLEELTLEGLAVNDAAVHRLADIKHLKRVELVSSRMSDRALPALEGMTELRDVVLRSETMGGANLSVLAENTHLKSLELAGGRISDATLTSLGQLGSLDTLELRGGHYSPRAIDKLQGLPNLSKLVLRSQAVNDQVVAHVAELKALKRVTLEGPVAGSTLESLSKLDDLESLAIISTIFNEQDVGALAKLASLKRIYLKTLPLNNGSLAKLAELKKLESIEIQTAGAFNEAGLKHLAEMKNLKSAHLTGLKISMEAYDQFHKEHPDVNLSPRPEWGDKLKEWTDKWKDKNKGGDRRGPRR